MKPEQFIGLRLFNWRNSVGLSQEKLAELINVSTRTLQSWEAGTKLPRIDTLIKCADLMGVSLDYLTGRSSDWRINSDF